MLNYAENYTENSENYENIVLGQKGPKQYSRGKKLRELAEFLIQMDNSSLHNAIIYESEAGESNFVTDTGISISEAIKLFEVMQSERGMEGIHHKRNGMPLVTLKRIASYFGMKQSLPKQELVNGIALKIKNMKAIDGVINTQSTSVRIFRRDKNTVPRILNILTTYPEGLLRTRSRANWADLQNGSIYSRADVWANVADNFNDIDFNSGGLPSDHEILRQYEINPENINSSGDITGEHCYNFFWECQKKYSEANKKFTASATQFPRLLVVLCQPSRRFFIELIYLSFTTFI